MSEKIIQIVGNPFCPLGHVSYQVELRWALGRSGPIIVNLKLCQTPTNCLILHHAALNINKSGRGLSISMRYPTPFNGSPFPPLLAHGHKKSKCTRRQQIQIAPIERNQYKLAENQWMIVVNTSTLCFDPWKINQNLLLWWGITDIWL